MNVNFELPDVTIVIPISKLIKDMNQHNLMECLYSVTPCIYAKGGCQIKGILRKDLQQHLKDVDHTLFIQAMFQDLNNTINKLQNEVGPKKFTFNWEITDWWEKSRLDVIKMENFTISGISCSLYLKTQGSINVGVYLRIENQDETIKFRFQTIFLNQTNELKNIKREIIDKVKPNKSGFSIISPKDLIDIQSLNDNFIIDDKLQIKISLTIMESTKN
eukprot:gene1520-1913_t